MLNGLAFHTLFH